MNRRDRRAYAARSGMPQAPTLFRDLDKLVRLATLRASLALYDGRDTPQNRALIMNNHGLLTVGKSARDAFVLMHHLIEAAEIQIMLESTGKEVLVIPDDICAKTVKQYEHHDAGRGSADWAAYMRKLDKIDRGYRN